MYIHFSADEDINYKNIETSKINIVLFS